jgi:hypothetical protein
MVRRKGMSRLMDFIFGRVIGDPVLLALSDSLSQHVRENDGGGCAGLDRPDSYHKT